MQYLVTKRGRGKLLRAIVAADLLKAQEAGAHFLGVGPLTPFFRRHMNTVLTYRGDYKLTCGDVTIEPISIGAIG